MSFQTPPIDDQILLLQFMEGDRKAFETLYHRHWEGLYRLAFGILKDHDASMDILQEVFTWFWEHRTQVAVKSVPAYLGAAVKYKVANHIRSGKMKESAFEEIRHLREEATIQANTFEFEELKEIISQFTADLPARCRDIFRLSRTEHLSNKEIAIKLDLSEKTVENQITIALRKLRTSLGDNAFLTLFL